MKNRLLEIEGYCRLWGETFSPKIAERKTGIRFDRKNEPGENGTIGRYKGRPIPYGSAEIDFKNDGDSADLFSPGARILDILKDHLPSFQAAGVKEAVLNVNVFYKEQCNIEQSPELLRRLAGLGVALNISCQQI